MTELPAYPGRRTPDSVQPEEWQIAHCAECGRHAYLPSSWVPNGHTGYCSACDRIVEWRAGA